MAKRVFNLARELGVTSKVILTKCRAEGLELKNHMATLSAGLEATIREWFSESAAGTAVETTEHVDLEVAREAAKKTRRRAKKKPKVADAPAEPPEASDTAEAVVAAEAPSDESAEVPGEPCAVAEDVVGEAEAPPAAPAEELSQTPQAPVAEADEADAAAPEEVPPADEPILPAGPQVVPRPAQLKGPRVIRVEKPDFVRAPMPRRSPPSRAPSAGVSQPQAPGPETTPKRGRGKAAAGGASAAEEQKKKGKKRSPRRRGGRSADSGEGLREWRDKDLMERSARLAAAVTGGLRRHRAAVSHKGGEAVSARELGRAEVDEPITVKSFSAATGLKSIEIIRQLMEGGQMVTVTQCITTEMAEQVAAHYGIELVIRRAKTAEEELFEKIEARPPGEMTPRAPVVTFLGHVDHGKTSLLDHIRNATVASGEAGGITQHIGAYRYESAGRDVVFLDTPGHEAFTAMRARGANMTDVVVLVVAADDGVMPQTIEAIDHAKAAKAPIIVALNKIDLPNANIDRVLGQLAEHDLNPREWGGDTEVIRTSATKGDGVDNLVETLSLEAEILELQADAGAAASGFVIEARMDPGMGVLARLLVRTGTMRTGDVLLAGKGYGRVRRMVDSHGRVCEQVGPSTPVEVAGLDEMPEAGDRFCVADSIDQARTVAEDRRQRSRSAVLVAPQQITLENLFSRVQAGQLSELSLIIKADVQGSIEALTGSIDKLTNEEVRVNVLHAAAGGITTGDVALAEASNAIIIGFNVVPDAAARRMAEAKGVDIRMYRVIYEVIDDIRKALEEGLAPEIREETLGHAEVRAVFKVSRVGSIGGCYVTDGVVMRNAKVRIIRDNVVLEDERVLESLKRFKDDAREVRSGLECGVKIARYDDIKEGDVLEFYQSVEVARTL